MILGRILIAFFLSAMVTGVRAETLVYGLLTGTANTPYWQSIQRGLRDGAREEGVDLYSQSIDSAKTNSAMDVCNNMLDRKPNILMVALPDMQNLPACFEKAQSLSIPVIGIGDTSVQHDNLSVHSVTDMDETAALTANYLTHRLGASTTGSVVVLSASTNKVTTEKLIEKLQESSSPLAVISATPDDLINVAPDIKAIISTDKTSTMTAISNKKPADISFIISTDSTEDNTKLLENGDISAAVVTLPYMVGKRAIQHASQVINGNRKSAYTKPVLLTNKMLMEGSDPILEFVQ